MAFIETSTHKYVPKSEIPSGSTGETSTIVPVDPGVLNELGVQSRLDALTLGRLERARPSFHLQNPSTESECRLCLIDLC